MDARLTVVVAGDDLLFATRVASALTKSGHRPRIVRTAEAFREALREGPDAGILNLASRKLDAMGAIRQARTDPETQTIPLLGFCGHADTARRTAARAAGCDLVATNAEIVTNLPRLLGALLGFPRASTSRR